MGSTTAEQTGTRTATVVRRTVERDTPIAEPVAAFLRKQGIAEIDALYERFVSTWNKITDGDADSGEFSDETRADLGAAMWLASEMEGRFNSLLHLSDHGRQPMLAARSAGHEYAGV